MAISAALKTLLQKHRVKFKAQRHAVVYTAQEIAAAEHVPGAQWAKCVLIRTNTGFWLAVLPATHLIDLSALKRGLGVSKIALASEADIRRTFPDVEIGAMSAFGNLYQVPVVVDLALADCSEIVCNAGTHTDTISVTYRDFEELVKPRVAAFGQHVGRPKSKAKARPPASKRSPRPPASGSKPPRKTAKRSR
ncbi:MAG: YbaK/EbsC family protein [Candidatus Omnitrophica bacterium]|nr:YbaK/EbsC family protein [Candidatus Omnitrophota bacterium]